MRHLIPALPIVALPVLWLPPLGAATPVYAVTVGIAIAVHATAIKARTCRPMAGAGCRAQNDGPISISIEENHR